MRGGHLGHVWDLISMFVASKGMEYSLHCYHFQDPMLSMMPTPLFFIDVNKTRWEHDDALHVD